MKQTAVKWLENELRKNGSREVNQFFDLFDQAKAMEKEQIKKSYTRGLSSNFERPWKDEEQYYNETFKP